MAQVEEPRTGRQLPWYRGVSGYAWLVLVVAALGWLFDTLDQQLFTLIRFRSLQDILSAYYSGPALDEAVQRWGYKLTSIFLVGWALGGLLFGILGDKIGRARTMMITILIYALFTGLNALVHTPLQYAFCRFFTALGIGGEFAAGASLVAEVWPARSRPMALGFLQALSTVGNMMAAIVTFVLAEVSWRWVYVVGIAPALLVVVIRLFVREPEKWKEARAQTAADPTKELGSIRDLFTLPGVSRNTWAALLIALAGVLGLWGIGYFQPDLISKVMQASGASESDIQRAKSTVFFIFQIGGFMGLLVARAILSGLVFPLYNLFLGARLTGGRWFDSLAASWRSFAAAGVMALVLWALPAEAWRDMGLVELGLRFAGRALLGIAVYSGTHLLLWHLAGRPDASPERLLLEQAAKAVNRVRAARG